MKWTLKKPTEQGFYYVKLVNDDYVHVCEIRPAQRPDLNKRLMVYMNEPNECAEQLKCYDNGLYEWCKIPNPPSTSKKNIKVQITTYKDMLLIEALQSNRDKYFIPNHESHIGCVIIDTEKHLGISPEALEWMKQIPKSTDDIGDIDTWKTSKETEFGIVHCFGWLGDKKEIKRKDISGSRDYNANIPHITIENTVPTPAKNIINEWINEGNYVWEKK